MVKNIALSRLLPHPLNSNRMDSDTFAKLRRHIEKSGRYEPLTVRPHPLEAGKFEVVNGRHRMKALQSLGHNRAICNVWELDDDQTHQYLATLNRLSGSDVSERRAILLEELLEQHELSELIALLPDLEGDLKAIAQLDGLDVPLVGDEMPSVEQVEMPQVMTFMLSDAHATELNMAIDRMIDASRSPMARGEALVAVARFYLGHTEKG